jgi:hypothetical protein
MFAGEPDTHPTDIIKSRNDFSKMKDMGESKPADTLSPSPVFNAQDLIGLDNNRADRQLPRGTIAQLIEDHESSVEDNPTRIQFRASINNDGEEIITYNKMLEYITKDEESNIMWKFRQIISLKMQGSQHTLLIEWENG